MKNFLLLITLLIFSTHTYASDFILNNVNKQEIDDLTQELGADWIFTTVSGAGPTGDLIPGFGFEVGVVAGATDAPTWARIIKEEDPNSDIDKLPHLNIIATASVKPLGLTFELGLIPEKSNENASIKNTAIGVKWTFIDHGLYQFATRFHANSNELSFTDTDSLAGGSSKDTTAFDTKTWGLQVIAGANLLGVIEPYAGLGFIKSNTDTRLSSNVSFDSSSITDSALIESSHSGLHFMAGAVIDLFILNLGVEYMRALDTSRIAGKISINI